MIDNNKVSILKLARRVRAWAETHRIKVWKRYKFEDDLGCMCAYASTVLLAYLHHHGYSQAKLVHNDRHAFILVDGQVLDVTATQFFRKTPHLRFKPVEFCSIKNIQGKAAEDEASCWQIEKVANNIEDAFNQLCPKKEGCEGGFPDTQYWSKRYSMRNTVEKAIEACEKMTHI